MTSAYFTLPSVSIGANETATVLGGTAALDDDHRHVAMALLLSCLKGLTKADLSTTEIVFACMTLALPDLTVMSQKLSSVKRVEVLVSDSDIDEFLNDEAKAKSQFARFVRRFPYDSGAIVITDSDGLYAALASVLMAVGKQPGSGPEAAGVKSRPKALIDRFLIAQGNDGLLPGKEFGPSTEKLELIYSALSTYTEFRMFIVQLMLAIRDSTGHPPRNIEILMTNFRLMRGAGMTHVGAILKLMNMHPWTVRVPELGPYYSKFATESGEFETVPKGVREYHRLLVPQSDYKFLTVDYKPLIAVAGHYVKEVERMFGNYVYGAADFAALISKVQMYEPTTARFIGVGVLAQRLGIQDMELPTQKAEISAPKTEVI
jgi:hypothetical protein